MESTDFPITIVIPVHNRAGIVGDTLRSVESQTYRPLRVIVVDNGSTDDTPAVVEDWKQRAETDTLRIDILTEAQPGATAARNRGLEEVQSEYVMFFDSDDIMHPGHVARAMKGFSSASNPDIVGWDVTIHPIGAAHQYKRKFRTSSPIWHHMIHGNMSTQRYAARTELMRRAGGWNNAIKGWNDLELGIRLLKLHPRLLKLPGASTVDVIQREVSITGTDFSRGAGKWERSLEAISASLSSQRHRRWVRLRMAHLAGLYASEGSAALARDLLAKTLTDEPSRLYRPLFTFTAWLTGHRIRGALTLMRPFF
ncbi:MAG: glycosyltransferase family 2 protein [Bacteroidales bacterium]|nr:glycosyltransferase family 2 protein [Bacteroidales bacterium]